MIYSFLIGLRFLGRNVGSSDVELGVMYCASFGGATRICRKYSPPSALGDEIRE